MIIRFFRDLFFKPPKKMKIIVGLGNPGLKYECTRHNVGFMVIERFAEKNGIAIKKSGYNGIYGVGKAFGEEVLLLKPLTFMNLSGGAVSSAVKRHLGAKEDLMVVTDDFAIGFEQLRVREKGSAGGHNGLKSIIEKIGDDFPRLRVGIASEGMCQDRATFVLDRFSKAELSILDGIIDEAVLCLENWLESGIRKAMNSFNTK
jgi:peptidyl-tRNA hydrolase, PTH1 family